MLSGYKVHFVPGWDCHGMPIEQKALAKIRADEFSIDPVYLRNKGESTRSITFRCVRCCGCLINLDMYEET